METSITVNHTTSDNANSTSKPDENEAKQEVQDVEMLVGSVRLKFDSIVTKSASFSEMRRVSFCKVMSSSAKVRKISPFGVFFCRSAPSLLYGDDYPKQTKSVYLAQS